MVQPLIVDDGWDKIGKGRQFFPYFFALRMACTLRDPDTGIALWMN
ncbi:MAG: hypothetical protein H7A12_03125 [Pseudomonadales bacterium]|nr:hypothetical protein [Pseudomonadales bacterium]MCP5337930.1 hypothetical protein [Pseudomonadales bacterium]